MKYVTVELKANPRGTKKSEVKRLRNEGNIPAVLYGNELESKAIYINEPEFIKVYRTSGKNGVITLTLDNESHPVMVYDLQIDRLKNEVIHADLYKVNMNEEIESEVPVHLKGEAIGARDGGVVQHLLYELAVKALPAKFPSSIEIEIDDLQIGDTIQVSDLPVSEEYIIVTDPEETIVTVTAATEEVTESEEVEEAPEGTEENEEDEKTEE